MYKNQRLKDVRDQETRERDQEFWVSKTYGLLWGSTSRSSGETTDSLLIRDLHADLDQGSLWLTRVHLYFFKKYLHPRNQTRMLESIPASQPRGS